MFCSYNFSIFGNQILIRTPLDSAENAKQEALIHVHHKLPILRLDHCGAEDDLRHGPDRCYSSWLLVRWALGGLHLRPLATASIAGGCESIRCSPRAVAAEPSVSAR